MAETKALDFFPRKDEMVAFARKRTPAARLVTPEEIARVVAWLCTVDAKMIVGQIIVIDDGYQVMA